MSNFKDDDYVKEFICRTQMNYFMIQKLAGHNKNKEISCLKKIMFANEFEYQKCYEITQLINSFLGLLVFPKEKYFNFLSSKNNDFTHTSTLKKLTNKTYDENYENTYKENNCERNVIRHLRNAVCHRRLTIYPLTHNKSTEIQKIKFEDVSTQKGYEGEFSLIINIDDLEKIVLELNRCFLCPHLGKTDQCGQCGAKF